MTFSYRDDLTRNPTALLRTEIDIFLMRGHEAISYIHRELRVMGWCGLGDLVAFESLLRHIGYTVRVGRTPGVDLGCVVVCS